MDGRICSRGRLSWRRDAAGTGELAMPLARPGTVRQSTERHGTASSRPRGPPAAFASRLIAPVTLQFPK